jgi:AraC-like DNA-binding protein
MKFFYENKDLSIQAQYGTSLAFGAHLHNHIELVYMLEGRTKLLVDSKTYIVSEGDAFIIFPNQIHQYQKIDNERYFISIFPTELCPEFQAIFKSKVPVSPVVERASNNKKILPIVDSIVEVNMHKPLYYHTCIKGYLLILLSELFQMMSFENLKSPDANTIKAILNYCADNYTSDIQLETVSEALHISKYYISHLFSQKLHMSFSEYIGTLRISEACRLLKSEEMSITDVAYNVGFNTTRSFNRLFLRYTGMTPRQYKKN